MNYSRLALIIDEIKNIIDQVPTAIQVFIYSVGPVLFLAGFLPGQDFGVFIIPKLGVFIRVCAGLLGAAHLSVFFLLLLRSHISIITIAIAGVIGVSVLGLVISSLFTPSSIESSERSPSTNWIFVSMIHRQLLSASTSNHPREYRHLDDRLKRQLYPDKSVDFFADLLDLYAPGIDHAEVAPIVFVTGPGQTENIVFDLLGRRENLDDRRFQVVLGMIAYRESMSSISPIIVSACTYVPCTIGTIADQAIVFIYPLNEFSKDMIGTITSD